MGLSPLWFGPVGVWVCGRHVILCLGPGYQEFTGFGCRAWLVDTDCAGRPKAHGVLSSNNTGLRVCHPVKVV